MKSAKEIMQSAAALGACAKSGGVSDWKSLVWLFFTPQGREFCEENNFPSLEMFRGMKEGVEPYGVWVDAGNIKRSNDIRTGLIGGTRAELTFDDDMMHKVILMHGAEAHIRVSGYAVVLVVNVGGCRVEIEKDKTAVIL